MMLLFKLILCLVFINQTFGQILNLEFLETILPLFSINTDNEKCISEVKTFIQSLRQGEEWALKMIDASAKPQSGILFGNIMHVGNYDECLKFNGSIQGKYCTALFQPHPVYGQDLSNIFEKYLGVMTKKEEDQLTTAAKKSFGFCVPKSCSASFLQTLADYYENYVQSPLHFQFTDTYCDAGDGIPLSIAAIIAIIIFTLFALIVILSTFYDLFIHKSSSLHLLVSFSLVSNGKKLFSTKTGEDNLNCLNGLRVISMMWIVLAHGFMMSFFVPEINASEIFTWGNARENSFVLAASMAVDTFFTISGLLVVYLFLKNEAKGGKFSIPMFYLHRIWRLTPSLAMVVLFSATLLKYMGSGPFWVIVDEMYQKPCERSWWSTLIYLQNYIHTHDQCVGQAWYLSVDTQMYFISPVILFPLVRWPKKTLMAIAIFVVLNCAYVFEISIKKHLGADFFQQDATQYAYIYSPTHVRGTIYLIGMICGYFVHITRNKCPKLSNFSIILLWICSLGIMLTIVVGHTNLLKNGYNALEASFFNSFTRVSWAVALSILILLCVNGYGGIINNFLSSKIFVVLIRLNYNVYLLHLFIMMFIGGQLRTPSYFSNMFGFHKFWGDYAFALSASILWTLCFEAPFLAIEKLIFGKNKKTVKQFTNNNQVQVIVP